MPNNDRYRKRGDLRPEDRKDFLAMRFDSIDPNVGSFTGVSFYESGELYQWLRSLGEMQITVEIRRYHSLSEAMELERVFCGHDGRQSSRAHER
jgi:hypothetical protein